MNKYRITNPKFEGYVEIVYESGVLKVFDFRQVDFNATQVAWVKDRIPAQEQNLERIDLLPGTKIIEVGYVIEFEEFWNLYGKKQHLMQTKKIWEKMSEADKLACIAGVKRYKHYLNIVGWQGQMLADTYLRNKCWLDEYK